MFRLMKRVVFVVLGCVCSVLAHGHCFSGELATELHWNMKQKVNWANQLRLNLSIPLWNGAGSIEASTLHMLRTNETIIDDWQGFSNIEEENTPAAIAVLGYMHQWERAHLFFGVRNVNEDFFTSDVTSLFFNGSCGIFPTIAASYPIANYPLSGLTVYFDVSKGGFTFRNSLYNGVGYNGWSKHDNPFLVRPKKDGIFNMSQLEFSYSGGNYFAGAAVHTRHYGVDPDGNQCEPDQSTKKASCAWWVYGEQKVWQAADKEIACMAQYSENTNDDNGCYRYAELGVAYTDSCNQCGLSGQYARFYQGEEYSLELTWRRSLKKWLSVQPSLQYINNRNGDFVVLCTRLTCEF